MDTIKSYQILLSLSSYALLHCTNMVAIMDSTCVTATVVTVPFKIGILVFDVISKSGYFE